MTAQFFGSNSNSHRDHGSQCESPGQQARLPGFVYGHRTTEVLEAFLTELRATGRSPAYEAWLRGRLRPLVEAYELLPERPDQITAVLAELRRRDGGPVSAQTRFDCWLAMRTFFNWAHRTRGVANPMQLVRRPLVRAKLPRTFSLEEVARLLELHAGRSLEDAVLRTILDTGARIGEVHNLERNDVGAGHVRLDGKTGEREVSIDAMTSRALLRRLQAGETPWIGKRGPLTLNGLQRRVRNALARTGLEGGPHRLRHTYGRLYLEAGGDVFSLQQAMGHRLLATTQIYTRLDQRHLRERHRRYSPLANLHLVQDAGDGAEASAAD